MRRKLIFGVTKVDTTDLTDYQGPANAAVLSVLRPGALVGSGNFADTEEDDVDSPHPGGLVIGDYCHIEEAGVVDTDSKLKVLNIVFAVLTGTWAIELKNESGSTKTWSNNSRIVLINDSALYSGHFVTVYIDDTTSTTQTNPATLGQTAVFEGYVDSTLDVDIAISGSGLTTKYYTDIAVDNRTETSVFEFGAVDDINTDSSGAIQRAIDWAGSHNGVVYFPKGDYRIETPLSFDGDGSDGLTLRGEGPELSRFLVIGDIDCVRLIDTWGVVIDGIDFHHAGTNPTAESIMIKLDGANRTRIQNCLFTNCWTAIRTGKATSVTKTQNVFITDCMVDIGHGESHATQILFNILDTIGLVVENVLCQWGSATIDAGWSIDDGVDTAALTNVACTQAGGGVGIAFRTIQSFASDHECRWIKFTNCYAEGGTEQGWYLTSGYDIALTNCYAVASLHGIHINGAEDVRISDSLCKENDTHGIYVESGDKVVIADNTVARNNIVSGGIGINVAAGVGGRILGNFVGKTHAGGTTAHTIGINLAADEWICANNEVSGGSSHGINVTADRCIVTGNVSKDNTGFGVAIQSGAADTILTGNIVDTNTAGDFSDAGTKTLFRSNHGNSDRAIQEQVASATAMTIAADTDTVKVSGTANISSILTAVAGRRLNLFYGGAGLTLLHNASGSANELSLDGAGNVVLEVNDMLSFEVVDVGGGVLQWIQVVTG